MDGTSEAPNARIGPRRTFLRAWHLIVVLALIAIAAIAFVAFSHVSDLARVKALNEAGLASPGSTLLGSREQDSSWTVEGPRHASIGHLYGTSEGAADVESFLAHALAEAGWEAPDDIVSRTTAISSTAELRARAWRKGDFVFRLGILRAGDIRTPEVTDDFTTAYTVDILLDPAPPRIRVRNDTGSEISVRTLVNGVDTTIADVRPGAYQDLTQSWFQGCTQHDLVVTIYERYIPNASQVEVARHPPGLCFGDTWTVTR